MFQEKSQSALEMMATFTVDAEGNRIQTDILVAGWIRECAKTNKLEIPNDITNTCFVFWFIKVCEEIK